jgi:serine phosphatase RsbU (regulator of sigma subunit)
MDDYPFEVASRVIAPGETCVLYTDGVSEAMNANKELYGIDRLKQLVQKSTAGKAEELGKTILADVRKHADGFPQNDDITIMVFGRKA